MATISLLHERGMRRSDTLNEQLQTALNSRVIIEQAKGKLAERLGLDMDQAFGLLRDYARSRNRRLSDLAQAFVDGSETLTALTASATRQRTPRTGPAPHHPPPNRPRRPPGEHPAASPAWGYRELRADTDGDDMVARGGTRTQCAR